MITDAMAHQFKRDCLDGVHQPGDEYRIALLKGIQDGTYDAATDTYSEGMGGDEVETGGGYTQGGQVLTGRSSALAGGVASVDWDNATWPTSTITAGGAVIFNATRSNKVVGVFNLRDGSGTPTTVSSISGDFTVQIPASGTGLLRIS